MEAAVQTAADAEKWIALMKQYVDVYKRQGLYDPAKVYSGHGRMHLDGATLFAPEALFHELHPEITSCDYSWSIVNDAKKTDYVGAELKNIVASHSNIALEMCIRDRRYSSGSSCRYRKAPPP